MPCNDGGPSTNEVEYANSNALLCAIVRVLEKSGNLDHVLNEIDWAEAGVTKATFFAWWERHKRMDGERRQREAETARVAALRRSAEAKLTPEEREAMNPTRFRY